MNDPSVIEKRKTALDKELEDDISYAQSKAQANHRLSLALMTLALGCSLIAAICGIFFETSSKIVGAIALLPPLFAYIAVTLKLEDKSGWHYRKSHTLRAIQSKLRYQLPELPSVESISVIARERDEVNISMLGEWEKDLRLNWNGVMHKNDVKPQSNEPPQLHTSESSRRDD